MGFYVLSILKILSIHHHNTGSGMKYLFFLSVSFNVSSMYSATVRRNYFALYVSKDSMFYIKLRVVFLVNASTLVINYDSLPDPLAIISCLLLPVLNIWNTWAVLDFFNWRVHFLWLMHTIILSFFFQYFFHSVFNLFSLSF